MPSEHSVAVRVTFIGWLSVVAARAPYLSGAIIILVGLYVGYHGYMGLTVGHA